jgi:hypothetical protein
MPCQPFIYGDNNNTTFAVVAGTLYWSIDLFAIQLNFIFQQTHDFPNRIKIKINAIFAVGYWLLVQQTHSLNAFFFVLITVANTPKKGNLPCVLNIVL